MAGHKGGYSGRMLEIDLTSGKTRVRPLEDDILPVRLRTEPLPEGPKRGEVFTDEDTRKMQDSYYAYYGGDDNGISTEETLNN